MTDKPRVFYDGDEEAIQKQLYFLDKEGIIELKDSEDSIILFDNPETLERKKGFFVAIITDKNRHMLPYLVKEELLCFIEQTAHFLEILHIQLQNCENIRKQLNRANQTTLQKDEYISVISHEIRNPLTGVIGTAELLMGTDLNENQQRYVNNIRTSSELLLGLINDILDLAKIETKKLELEISSFNLLDTVKEVVLLLEIFALHNDVELAVHIKEGVPSCVEGDRLRLRQILINLVNNAVKFTKGGYVLVEIEALEEQEGKKDILFKVIDNGIGIEKTKQKDIFKSFKQGDISYARRYGGTGLGLSISSQLVYLMGGELELESEPNLGSTFSFKLPMKLVQQDETQDQTQILFGKKVLVVDDYPINQSILTDYLKRLDMEIVSVFDAEQALVQLDRAYKEGKPFHFALIDYALPTLNGKKLGETIKKDPRFSTLRLILVTALGKFEDFSSIEDSGFSSSVLKPIYYQEITSKMTEAYARPVGSVQKRERKPKKFPKYHATILVAEDFPPHQVMIKELLEKLGCRVELVSDGLEALHELREKPDGFYDLVLMDILMPRMDGLEAVRRIRHESFGKNLVIVALTSATLQKEISESLGIGFNDYISKPLSIETMIKIFDKHFASIG